MKKIRTTHVGSLPRPQEMLNKAFRKQEISREELEKHLAHVLERQMELGIDIVNNGELSRSDYVRATVERISGFNEYGMAPLPRDLEELPELSRRFNSRNGLITLNPKAIVRLPACSQPLEMNGEDLLREELDMLVGLHQVAKKNHPDSSSELFFTSPSPGTVSLFMENKYYNSDEEYLVKIGEILKEEYKIITSYGVQLQIDCPDLAMGRHTRYKDLTDQQFLERIDLNIQVLNAALSEIDPERCRIHVCWGNYPGTHHSDIGLRKIFDKVMNVNAKYISLESSNHRHAHEWVVFKEVVFPEEKVLLPGVIDTSSNVVEHPDLVAQRIRNFVDIIGVDRVIASTDCGFATTASASSVAGDVAWLKLASLVDGARRAEKSL